MARTRPTFELARFAWGTPDRLELAGRFVGLADLPADAPELVISGANGVHRLPVVPESLSGPPEDGGRWEAVFAWQDAPVAFDVAKLEFGDDIIVELPEPSARRTRARRQTLEVSQQRTEEREDTAPAEVGQGNGVEQLRVHAELLATQESLRDAQTNLQRSEAELIRVRDELASERELRSADSERFRQGLAEMSGAAQQEVAREQRAAQQAGAELRDALELIEALRERVAALEEAGQESDQLRADLEVARMQAAEAGAELDQTRSALADVRSDAERLLGRLSAFRDAAGEGV
jgi:hypothetical protein